MAGEIAPTEKAARSRPILALTQGDPAGVGPEVLCKLLARFTHAGRWQPLLVVEGAALESVSPRNQGESRGEAGALQWVRGPRFPGGPG